MTSEAAEKFKLEQAREGYDFGRAAQPNKNAGFSP
jgi:hypothetical protein